MRHGILVTVGVFVTIFAALAIAAPADAHNYLISSTPSANQTLTTLPADFTITTSGVLLNLNGDGSGFALQVRDARGRFYGDGCLTVAGATISMPAAIGAPGAYTVTWQVVSTDGHSVSDTFHFTWAGAESGTLGQNGPPTCHGKYHFNASGLPAASTGTRVASDGALVAVLWIGGGVLAAGAAAVIALLIRARRRQR